MKIDIVKNSGSRVYTFSKMPENVEELKTLDISDEYQSACAIVFALAAYEKNPEAAIEMLEYVNGPENVSGFDKSFIKEQMAQYPYIMRSYFDGTSPENGYAVGETVSLTIKENPYSREEDGYVKLFFHSSGADSDRGVKLRLKVSTSQWFLFSDTYKGLMAGIKQPVSADPWN